MFFNYNNHGFIMLALFPAIIVVHVSFIRYDSRLGFRIKYVLWAFFPDVYE